jgi:hypothetical protein
MFIRKAQAIVVIALFWLLAGCSWLGPEAAAPTAPPTATVEITAISQPTEAASEPAPTGQPIQPEAIVIGRPGPGSTVTSPLQVQGVADPTFEQNLGLRLYRMTGELIAEGSATIDAPLGQRGPFSGELTFQVEQAGPALLQVYDNSARDGGLIHLSSANVMLEPSGQAQQIEEAPTGPEQIAIQSPVAGATLTGGRLQVAGVGRASFEATLVVEIIDVQGRTLVEQPLIVDEPAMGEPGPFSIEVDYEVEEAGPGRVVVYDPSPAFGGMIHLSSVEVQLQP